MTRETLCRGPLVQACRAHTASVERIPCVLAGTHPAILFARLPSAQRATDMRARRLVALFLVDLLTGLDRGLRRIFNCAAHNLYIMEEFSREDTRLLANKRGDSKFKS